jgi:hypothetical protein
MKLPICICSAVVLNWVACVPHNADFGPGDPVAKTDLQGLHASCVADSGVLKETPENGVFKRYLNEGFTRYVEVSAPGGGFVPIFAQDQVSEAKLRRARNLMRFYLSDVDNSQYGQDKSTVADSMVASGAVLMMPNGAHEEGNEPKLPAQPLYDYETPADGSKWFMNNNFNHRDAAFEEIFHLVHDAGIGTTDPGALPAYQNDLKAAAENALAQGIWGIPVDESVTEWIDVLRKEDSLAQEYIASVIDSYYGLWAPWTEADGGMWGIYIAKTREEVKSLDPIGYALLRAFLPETISAEIRLDPDLNQDFSLILDATQPYTHKSQYFVNVMLQGDSDIGLMGNAWDNELRGNFGDNTLNGSDGEDTAIYCDNLADFSTLWDGETLLLTGPQGTDRLEQMEWVHFGDGRIALRDL